MSLFQFIASDTPLKKLENEKIKLLSIEEMERLQEELQITLIPEYLPSDIDRQEKNILYAPDEEALDELAIGDVGDYAHYCLIYTEKKYTASISWRYSEERAARLLEYIRDHMENAEEVDLWSIWLDDYSLPAFQRCSLDGLTLEQIAYAVGPDADWPVCLIIEK